MKKVAVSIHANKSFSHDLIKDLVGLDYIHIDVMDGKFVPVSNLNLNTFRLIYSNYAIPIIAHLMVKNPLEFIDQIIELVHGILFHTEIQKDKEQIVKTIKSYNKLAGLVINPETAVEEIKEFLTYIDIILVMGVEPGWSGQKFNKHVIKKVKLLAEWKRNNKSYNYLIDVDGGVTLKNAKLLTGADILTSASTLLNSSDPNSIIKKWKSL